MSRLHDVNAIAISTLSTMIDELHTAAIGVDALAASVKVGTLEEIAERRASLQARIGDSRIAAEHLIETLKKERA